jgi:hypothetical protein
MNGGSDIGVKQVEWDNRFVFRLEGFRNGERLFELPIFVLAGNMTIKGVRSTWTSKR